MVTFQPVNNQQACGYIQIDTVQRQGVISVFPAQSGVLSFHCHSHRR